MVLLNKTSPLTKGHLKTSIKSIKISSGSIFSTQRVINVWNILPGHVVEAETLVVFKTRLDTLLDSTTVLQDTDALQKMKGPCNHHSITPGKLNFWDIDLSSKEA